MSCSRKAIDKHKALLDMILWERTRSLESFRVEGDDTVLDDVTNSKLENYDEKN
jgi:hypothetical protein